MKIYLEPEDYDIAEKNGIKKHNLEQRFYDYGWTAERARTQPLLTKRNYLYLQEQAKKNGIDLSYQTIASRKALGWSDKDIVEIEKGGRRKTSIYEDYREACEKNGVSRSTFYRRVANGWTKKDAATHPVNEIFRRKDYLK